MRLLKDQDYQTRLPEGFLAIPLNLAEASASVGLRVIVRKTIDPASGHFVFLRQTSLARVYLGSLSDVGGLILEWVEIWVQRSDPEGLLPGAVAGKTTNPLLDEIWAEECARFRATDLASMVATPYETRHPGLVTFDLATQRSSDCVEGGLNLALCRKDTVLAAAQLPEYGLSSDRYLVVQSEDGIKFAAVTDGAPVNERTVSLSSVLPANSIVFNPTCGLLAVRKFHPLALEDVSDLLGGAPWAGIEASKPAFLPQGLYQSLQDADFLRHGDGLFFGAAAGRLGRVPECLGLRLEMLRQAMVLVSRATHRSQLPMLNLTAESFRIRLTGESPGMPAFWTAQVGLVTPGEAYALAVTNSSGRYFQASTPLGPSVYRPEVLTIPIRGTASIRIREVFPESRDGTVIEATFSTQERPALAKNDLVRLQIPLPVGQIVFFGKLDAVDGMVRGEAIFRSLPEHFSAEQIAALTSLKGIPRSQLPFEIICPLSSPTDLFSIAVLGVRLLLVSPRRALPSALDALLSLGRELNNNQQAELSPAQCIMQIFEKEPGWLEALGPQNLLEENFAVEDVLARLPMTIWCEALALLIALFPGLTASSFCKDYGDADNLALHTIYEKPEYATAELCRRIRRLIFAEWKESSEISRVVGSILERYS